MSNKDMSNYEETLMSLAQHFPEAAEALSKKHEAEAEFNRWVAERIITPEFADAAVNLCRSLGIDPSADDPLKAYRETIIKRLVQTCKETLPLTGQEWIVIASAILDAPAPKEGS